PLLSFFYSYADPRDLPSFPTRRSSDLTRSPACARPDQATSRVCSCAWLCSARRRPGRWPPTSRAGCFRGLDRPRTQSSDRPEPRSEEHTSELQSLTNLVCRLLLEKKKT